MTMPTPETLARHELAGLRVRVVDAPNPDLVGIAGRVVRETTKTLVVEDAPEPTRARDGDSGSAASREPARKQVPKEGTTFEFALADEAAATREGAGTASERRSETASGEVEASQSGRCEGAAYVTVDGARLLSRPARRTETGGRPRWR